MKRHINYFFLILSTALALSGMLFLAALSGPASMQIFGNTNYYIFHQLIAFGIGLATFLVMLKIPLHFLKKISFFLLFANVILLVIVFVPFFGLKFWGANRWINIWGLTLQPSEFFKITAILYLSAWLSEKFSQHERSGWAAKTQKGYHNTINVFLPFLLLLGVSMAILLFQKDMSTLAIVVASLLAVYFAAGTPLWHTATTAGMLVTGAALAIKLTPYRLQRLLIFLNPEADPLGAGFQLKQSLLALGSGGIFGKGLGMSTQKFGFLPQAMSDSVFAIIGEELGIVGCSTLVIVFLLFFWQGIKISRNSTNKFSKLTAVGLSTWIMVQMFMNVASTMGLWPLSGIPLPFFSYGGSHLIAEMAAVGLLLNISKNG